MTEPTLQARSGSRWRGPAWALHLLVLIVALAWPFLADPGRFGLPTQGAFARIIGALPISDTLLRMSARSLLVWCCAMLAMLAVPWQPVVAVIVYAGVAVTYQYDLPGLHMQRSLWMTALAVTGTLVWMARRRIRLHWPPARSWPTWIMLLLTLWLAIASGLAWRRTGIWHPTPITGAPYYHDTFYWLVCLVMFVLASQFAGSRQGSFWLALVIVVMLGVRLRVLIPSVWRSEDSASLMVITMPLMWLALRACPWRRLGWWVLAGGMFLLVLSLLKKLYSTQNRAAALALCAALAAYALITRWRWALVPLLAGLVLGVGVYFSHTQYAQRFRDLLDHGPQSDSAIARLKIWHAAWEMTQDHPWTGVGPGEFPRVLHRYNAKIGFYPAHNNFLGMLAETGIPGLTLYSLLFLGMLCHLWRTGTIGGPDWPGPAARLLFPCLVAYLVVGLFISREDLPLAYILAGWGVALYNQMTGPDLLQPALPAAAH